MKRDPDPTTTHPQETSAFLDACWRRERRWVAAILLAHKPREAPLEDLLQDVALALVEHGPDVRDPSKMRPWLRTVAINVARGEGRRAGLRARLKRVLDDEREPVDPRSELDEDARQKLEEVLELVQRLSTEHREVLLLRAVRGCGQREIATLLGISVEAVESRLARARRELRRQLGSESPKRSASLPHTPRGDDERYLR